MDLTVTLIEKVVKERSSRLLEINRQAKICVKMIKMTRMENNTVMKTNLWKMEDQTISLINRITLWTIWYKILKSRIKWLLRWARERLRGKSMSEDVPKNSRRSSPAYTTVVKNMPQMLPGTCIWEKSITMLRRQREIARPGKLLGHSDWRMELILYKNYHNLLSSSNRSSKTNWWCRAACFNRYPSNLVSNKSMKKMLLMKMNPLKRKIKICNITNDGLKTT